LDAALVPTSCGAAILPPGVDAVFALFIGPLYGVPNSPGANTTTEQNPSVDVISKVVPSGDLRMSAKEYEKAKRSINLPSKISKSGVMKIAHDT